MYHYTYSISFTDTPHIYFGVRSSKCLPENDTDYMGSPKTFKHYWKKYNPIKTVLDSYETREESELAENKLILSQWNSNKALSLNASLGYHSFHTLDATWQRTDDINDKTAIKYYLISPCGEVSQGCNIRRFARCQGLDSSICSKVMRGCNFHHHGWTASMNAHVLYNEAFANRGITYSRYRDVWVVCEKRGKVSYVKTKELAIAYRDRLSSQGVTWRVWVKDWKARLAAMQAESA